jgi:hypothetical protein
MTFTYVLLQKSKNYFKTVQVVGVYTDESKAFKVLKHYTDNDDTHHYYLNLANVDNFNTLKEVA